MDPNDDQLATQLGDIKWKLTRGQIAVKSKVELRKRGLPSPDRADACTPLLKLIFPYRR